MSEPHEIAVDRCMSRGCTNPMPFGHLVCDQHWKRLPKWMRQRLLKAQRERSPVVKRRDVMAVAALIVDYLGTLRIIT